MKKLNLTVLFITVILFSVLVSIRITTAQPFNNSQNEGKEFGSSLKKSEKKKKVRPQKPQQNDPADYKNNLVDDEDVIRVETTLVTNEVLVLDRFGNPVVGLSKEDFTISEDSVVQEISVFLSGDTEIIPRSIVLIIDYSGSQLPYIETSIESAKMLIDKLNPSDKLAIVTDNVELLQNFTRDKTLLKEKLELLKVSALSGQVGTSKQYSALMATLNELFIDEGIRPIIIFQTDGDELQFTRDEIDNFVFNRENGAEFRFKDILKAIEKTRSTIYTIIPGVSFSGLPEKEKTIRAKLEVENRERAFAMLRNVIYVPRQMTMSEKELKFIGNWISKQQQAIAEIAKFSGGLSECLERPDQAEGIYSQILSRMNQRYVIGYYPTNQSQSHDNKSRALNFEIRGRPEYKIIGRKSYVFKGKSNL